MFFKTLSRSRISVSHFEERLRDPDEFLRCTISPPIPAAMFSMKLTQDSYMSRVIEIMSQSTATATSSADVSTYLRHCAFTLKDSVLKEIPEGRKWLFFLNTVSYETKVWAQKHRTTKSSLPNLDLFTTTIDRILRNEFGPAGVLPITLLHADVQERGGSSSRAKRAQATQEQFAGSQRYRACTDFSMLNDLNSAPTKGEPPLFDTFELGLLQHSAEELDAQVEITGLATEVPLAQKEAGPKKFHMSNQPVLMPVKKALLDTRLYTRTDRDRAKTLILCCSGSGSSSEIYLPQMVKGLLESDLDCAVLTFNYRGFGLSSDCEVDDKTITRDTQAMIDHAIRNLGYSPKDIFVLGFSLGSIPAIRVACGTYREPLPTAMTKKAAAMLGETPLALLQSAVLEKNPHKGKEKSAPHGHSLGGLITYGAISTTKDVMRGQDTPPGTLERRPSVSLKLLSSVAQAVLGFDSFDTMKRVTVPTLMIAGTDDGFLPQTEALYAVRIGQGKGSPKKLSPPTAAAAAAQPQPKLPQCRKLLIPADHLTHGPLFEGDALASLRDWYLGLQSESSALEELDAALV